MATIRRPARWMLRGAQIHNIGEGWTRWRSVLAIRREHRVAPFDVLQALFSGACGQVAAMASALLGVPYAVHIAGGRPCIQLPKSASNNDDAAPKALTEADRLFVYPPSGVRGKEYERSTTAPLAPERRWHAGESPPRETVA